jgi:membrane protease YdiL (CAAX protease family)
MGSLFVNFIKKHAFLSFLLLTVLISWGPWIMTGRDMLVFGPTIAGVILIAITRGKEGLRDIVKQLLRVQVRLRWWLTALLLPCAVAFAAIAVNMLAGNESPDFAFFSGQWHLILVFFLITFIGGPLGEEIGWRGFSVPYLQRKTTPLLTALIIGIAWGIWHLPEFLTRGALHHQMGAVYFPLFVLGEIALSIVMTWLYNKTDSSLLIAGLLFHNAENFWSVALTTNATMDALQGGQISVNMNLWILSVIIYAAFAVVLVIATKGQLGYDKASVDLMVDTTN